METCNVIEHDLNADELAWLQSRGGGFIRGGCFKTENGRLRYSDVGIIVENGEVVDAAAKEEGWTTGEVVRGVYQYYRSVAQHLSFRREVLNDCWERALRDIEQTRDYAAALNAELATRKSQPESRRGTGSDFLDLVLCATESELARKSI